MLSRVALLRARHAGKTDDEIARELARKAAVARLGVHTSKNDYGRRDEYYGFVAEVNELEAGRTALLRAKVLRLCHPGLGDADIALGLKARLTVLLQQAEKADALHVGFCKARALPAEARPLEVGGHALGHAANLEWLYQQALLDYLRCARAVVECEADMAVML